MDGLPTENLTGFPFDIFILELNDGDELPDEDILKLVSISTTLTVYPYIKMGKLVTTKIVITTDATDPKIIFFDTIFYYFLKIFNRISLKIQELNRFLLNLLS